ncbi:MAG: FAD-dependent monooxygenase [Solirubrobacterales bacterium]|nr:FAD-dependent monooxygenase [Solirubrobacterales bacterium]
MADRFDVVVVGARCAGSPLATLLARQGLNVAVVERAAFPKDTLSTHIFQAPAINFLRRLGVFERVLETGARAYTTVDLRQEDFRGTFAVIQRPGDAGAFMSVRRFVLDPILVDAATDAGAEALMSTNVTGLVREGDRVAGVRAVANGKERILKARLVVGADGRNSTVGTLAGARKYNVVPGERFGYWWFFADSNPGPDPLLVYHRWDGRFVIAMPADSGLYQVILLPDVRFLPEFREDREAAFMAHARACPPVAEMLEGAHSVGKMFGVLKFECFFRESAGPGWALVGDAGHFKDPAPGQGISDAFRQAEALVPVIVGAIEGGDETLDASVAAWARWRDRDAAEHYWLASDFGAAGRAPRVVVEVTRRLYEQGRVAELGDVFQHRAKPSAVFTPSVVLGAAGSAVRRPHADRREIVREVRALIATDARRRRLNRRPEYVPIGEHRDAGETEVPEEVAA